MNPDLPCVARLARLAGVTGWRGGPVEWPAVEASIGVHLPADYKALVETFPDGTFQGLVRLNRPGDGGHPVTEFLGHYRYRLDDMREWRAGGYGNHPYPIFPEPGGLLPWATGPRGELICWLTGDEDPDRWPVIVSDAEFTQWRERPGTACDFLLDLVAGRFDATIFGVDLTDRGPLFKPKEEPVGTPSSLLPAPFFVPGHAVNEFAALADALAPPARPAHHRLDAPLPADYVSFMDLYGSGTYCDITIDVAREAEPERRLIAWGGTDDGWTMWWAPTVPDPDRWGVVLVDPPFRLIEHRPDLSFSAFLLLYADPDRTADLIDERLPWQGGPRFTPRPPA